MTQCAVGMQIKSYFKRNLRTCMASDPYSHWQGSRESKIYNTSKVSYEHLL